MVYFLIPAYEEEGTLGLLLYKIRQVMREIRRDYLAVVLDDGSADGTAQVAEQYRRLLPVKLLRHAENRGFGPSLDRLLREATRLSRYPERDIAVVIEGDFSVSPDAVPDMVREIEAGADVVIGARTHHDSELDELPSGKRFGSRLVSTVLRAVMPLPRVTDYSSIFQAYRIGTLKRALDAHQEGLITSRNSAAAVELLLRLGRLQPTFAEVPVRCRYDIRPRGSRYRWTRAVREQLSLTGRVDRVPSRA
ncbi:MAG TPA: glycosyltransferase family 2 protein [Gemmatimonadota bacterium]|nr:glycosyltransferase family 2 protein [Gemmatimonadota bacterium]